MTGPDLQALYDRLKTVRAVARHLGRSTADICSYLRSMGVVVQKRGGSPGKIERNRVANESAGDPAFRARPVERVYCQEQRRPCVIADLGSCQACRAEHTLESVCAGASSGWTTTLIGAGR